MNTIYPIAKSTEEDCLAEEQLQRIASRPLKTEHAELAEFGSFRGRGVIILQLGHSIVREPYRAIKNLLIIAERIVFFIRTLLECLFKEHAFLEAKRAGRELLSGIGALPLRVLTYIMDLLKLIAGILIPAAAIRSIPGAE